MLRRRHNEIAKGYWFCFESATLIRAQTMGASGQSKNQVRSRVLTLLLTILIGYALTLVLLRLVEPHLIFFPNTPGRLEGDWHPRGLPVEEVWLTSSDGVKVHAWWIPSDHAKFTFLAFHGNAANITNRAPIYQFLRATPANVLALEYRGYGRSAGVPSEAGFYRDADAAYQYLVNTKGIDPRSIISFGQSIGTAVAAHLAAHRQVAGVILEAPFPSAAQLAWKLYWFLPGLSLLVQSQFNTQARLRETTAPLLVVHCTQDPIIPFKLGEAVYKSAQQVKYFVAVNSLCHEESSLMAPGEYRVALQKFLSTLGTTTTAVAPTTTTVAPR
jgi:uncharacterized protein